MAVLVARFSRLAGGKSQLDLVLFLFQPDTVLRWHRDLVRRQWTCTERRKTGRPATDPPVIEVLRRLAAEHPTWGDGQRQGALLTLGLEIGRATIRDLLKREHGPLPPSGLSMAAIGASS